MLQQNKGMTKASAKTFTFTQYDVLNLLGNTNPAEVVLGLLPAIFFIILSRFFLIISSLASSFTEVGVSVETVVCAGATALLVFSDDIPGKR